MQSQPANINPLQPSGDAGQSQLGVGCALVAFATLLVLLVAGVVAFGQPPAALLIVLVIPLFWAGLRLLRRADQGAR